MIQHIISITTLELPELIPYKTLKRPHEHQENGIFIVEGDKVTERLLKSNLGIISLLLTPAWFTFYKDLISINENQIIVYLAEKNSMETIVGHHLHKGIMGLGKIPKPQKIEDIINKKSTPYFFVAIDGITNAENMGVIVRNCAAFGVQALLIGENSCDPYLRRAVRNSMGTVFLLPIIYCSDLQKKLIELKNNYNIAIVASSPTATHTFEGMDFSKNCCIIIGSEGNGIRSNIFTTSTVTISIPMYNEVDSLNAGSASAVLLYEVAKQRKNILQ